MQQNPYTPQTWNRLQAKFNEPSAEPKSITEQEPKLLASSRSQIKSDEVLPGSARFSSSPR
jgi:hypothetical protein